MLRPSILFSRRYSPIVTYGASFAVTWGLLGLESRVDAAEAAVAFVLQLGIGIQLYRARRWDHRHWAGMLGMIVFLVSVVLLRDGVGPVAGYTPLLLLPVFWAAVRGRPAELTAVLAGGTVLLFAPVVFIGGAHYPSNGWPTDALWLVVAAGLGIGVLALVGQLGSSNLRHRLLADNSTDLIVRLAVDGTFMYVSAASRAMLGYEPIELVGRNIGELLDPLERPAQAEGHARADVATDPILQEFRVRHREGRVAVVRNRDPVGPRCRWGGHRAPGSNASDRGAQASAGDRQTSARRSDQSARRAERAAQDRHPGRRRRATGCSVRGGRRTARAAVRRNARERRPLRRGDRSRCLRRKLEP